jgi:hypothetical protein
MIFGSGGFSARVGIPGNSDRRKMFLRQTVTAHPFPLDQALALQCPDKFYSRLQERWAELLKENPDAKIVKVRMQGESSFEIRDPLHFSVHGYIEQFCRFTGEKAIFGFYLIPHEHPDDDPELDGELHEELDPKDEEAMKLYRTNGAEVLGDDPKLTDLPPDEKEFLESVWKCVPKIGQITGEKRDGPNTRCGSCGKKLKKCRCGGV